MRVAVLGGGLQGACVAMELADAGAAVHLYDRNAQCLTQASARNEGKIHLGYVYANDRSLGTARLMISGATTFAPLMRRWIGTDIDRVAVSTPFEYVVHRDSMLTVEDIHHHFRSCSKIAHDEHSCALDYFGMDYREPPVLLNGHENVYDGANVSAVFKTSEVGIDTEALADFVRARLVRTPNVCLVSSADVKAAAIRHASVEVTFVQAGRLQHESFDHVVNAAWDGRLAIDATAGLTPPRAWMYRIKHYVRAHLRDSSMSLPSSTVVLGPFGDVVKYDNGDVYLSWYPAGLKGYSGEVTPPDWPREVDAAQSVETFAAIRAGLTTVIPAVARLTPETLEGWKVKCGVIFAWGSTDIGDPASDLHERSRVGPEHFGRYHTINTGKLTVAPLFAKRTADFILDRPGP